MKIKPVKSLFIERKTFAVIVDCGRRIILAVESIVTLPIISASVSQF